MTIELAVGAPTTMLPELCPLGGIELCFAHLLSGDAEPYRAYYARARSSGRFVILDNGIMERGVAASLPEIVAVLAGFRPALVTPPEVLHDAGETLRLTEQFASCLREGDEPSVTGLLGAAHGSSFHEWCRCFEGLRRVPEVKRIGIPYDVRFDVQTATDSFHPLQRLVVRRIELCEWIARMHPDASVHLFGLAHPSELVTQRHHAFVASIDTSLPVMAAAHGIRYAADDPGPYEKFFLDVSLPWDSVTIAIAQHNIRVMTDRWLSPDGNAHDTRAL